MTPLFTRLNLKDQKAILIVDAPQSFDAELSQLRGVSVFRSPADMPAVSFAVIFVKKLDEITAAVSSISPRVSKDPVIWFAYPKGTSKRYRCDFNRDSGWAAVGAAGFEPVRMIAIDEDWSALRFRHADQIKTMTRDPAHRLSPAGQARARAQAPAGDSKAAVVGANAKAAQRFEATLVSRGPAGAWTFLPIPFEVQKVFGSKARVSVAGTLNGFPFRGSLLPNGDGTHSMAIAKDLQTGADAKAGDTVAVVMEADAAPRIVAIPDDLRAALKNAPEMDKVFSGLAYTHRKEFVNWIVEAKKPETRARRVEKCLAMAAEKKQPKM